MSLRVQHLNFKTKALTSFIRYPSRRLWSKQENKQFYRLRVCPKQFKKWEEVALVWWNQNGFGERDRPEFRPALLRLSSDSVQICSFFGSDHCTGHENTSFAELQSCRVAVEIKLDSLGGRPHSVCGRRMGGTQSVGVIFLFIYFPHRAFLPKLSPRSLPLWSLNQSLNCFPTLRSQNLSFWCSPGL